MDTGIGYMIQVISYMEVCIEDTKFKYVQTQNMA